MTLLAGFKALLIRYTGQTDIVVGTPVANRQYQELEVLIGFFVNTLVLRTDVSGDPTFNELVSRVRETALGAYAHQDLPLERLVEQLAPERRWGRAPLFQVMFVLQNAPIPALELPGLSVTHLPLQSKSAKFDLSLHLHEGAAGLEGTLEYSTDLFDASTMERMIEHYQLLLKSVIAYPDARLSTLPIITALERRHLVDTWGAGESLAQSDTCIHEWFERQVEKTPEALAVKCEDQELTYRELNERANQLANYLVSLNAKRD
jgi:non-ribosomal peptide synthetase component F